MCAFNNIGTEKGALTGGTKWYTLPPPAFLIAPPKARNIYQKL